MRWRDQALCAETDPELFFPDKGQSATPARRICFACPVRAECLTYALETGQDNGIWGGHTRDELRELRRATGIVPAALRILAPCGTPGAYRRHLRREGAPVTCRACLHADAQRQREWRYSQQGAS